MNSVEKQMHLADAIFEARSAVKRTGDRHYVSWSVVDCRYYVTARMPIMGEWFDSDGVRHG